MDRSMDRVPVPGPESTRYSPQSAPLADFIGSGDLLNLPEKLAFLVNYGERILLVTGAPGQGKSLAKQHLLKALADVSPAVELTIAQRTEAQLLQVLGNAFALSPAPGDKSISLARLRAYAQRLRDQNRRPVVVVDDAHWLKNKALLVLLQMAEQTGLALILFAEPSINRRAALNDADHQLYRCSMAGLNSSQVKRYLRRQAPSTLSRAQLDRILNDADGNIGAIEELIKADTTTAGGRWIMHVSVGLVLLLISLAAYLYEGSPGVDVVTGSTMVALPAPEQILAEEVPRSTQATQTAVNPQLGSQEDAIALPVATLPARTDENLALQIVLPVEPATASLDGQGADSDMGALPVADSTVDAVAEALVSRAEPSPRGAAGAVTEPNLAITTTVEPRRQPWIETAEPGEYTLQLMGSYSETGIQAVINSMVNPEGFSYFETRRGSQPWYVLTAGRYPDRLAAMEAVKDLPSGLQEMQPWARSVESIRASLGSSESQ